jgi:non-homologous end joining protein Ku
MQKAFSVLSILSLSIALSGCVAAGAGAAAADATTTPSREAIEYVRTHNLEPYIGRAIERGDVVRGMSKEDVRFVEGDPREVREEDGRTVWIYGSVTQRTRIYFENGEVADIG